MTVARWAWLPVLVVVLVLGLLPFTAVIGGTEGLLRAHCHGALIEAWPESGHHNFGYAGMGNVQFATGSFRETACGAEARTRAVPGIAVVAAVGAIAAAALAIGGRRG